ncbi:MAG: uroporphyrinogen decarboxylase family protein [Candidatus Latescibacteria bacterium]|nr:uroporphyrinogen decarboxylase family protein [Candidatus Latescibacterota bacterium]
MTHRERMLATIRGEPTDQIPWAPRMDLWYIAHNARGTLPEQFQDLNTVQIAEQLDVACHAVGADFTQTGNRDVSLRALGIDNHADYPYRVELRDLPIEWQDDGENLTARIQTSAGEITTHLYRTQQMQKEGISLPFFKSYAIESPDDFDAVGEIFEHLKVIPTPDAYRAFQTRVGDRGIAVARGPMAASPIHLMLHELVAMDQFFYLYTDVREKMHTLSERMTPFFDAALEALVISDAEVVFWGANYDQDLTWPPFFETEIAPWLQKAANRLHDANKLLLTHTDGENKGLLPLYPACNFEVAESVCPHPMTECTLADIRTALPNITIWGGIPSVTLMPSTMNDTEFEAYLDKIFNNLGTGDHLIFGVADNVPPEADLERLERIKERIAAFGSVSP